ncbi:uncharacterized protein K452DRAFT_125663 [Aplosporella prunicola CBS 121167]|uniref:Uncharacterized protein n=1 Tax=Aplosporella prunicola CBS 121167 TaxID=1176127 RepID=A0A6A6BR70_9PEZI|nr:uncharacterized protein K452DRAFT_125663 [Aplosporella prunicola CBS 121167]KAF2145795.1 hypothetical protein K452DRAFT_125663 [Aplosporella prunicola CBS 121167]
MRLSLTLRETKHATRKTAPPHPVAANAFGEPVPFRRVRPRASPACLLACLLLLLSPCLISVINQQSRPRALVLVLLHAEGIFPPRTPSQREGLVGPPPWRQEARRSAVHRIASRRMAVARPGMGVKNKFGARDGRDTPPSERERETPHPRRAMGAGKRSSAEKRRASAGAALFHRQSRRARQRRAKTRGAKSGAVLCYILLLCRCQTEAHLSRPAAYFLFVPGAGGRGAAAIAAGAAARRSVVFPMLVGRVSVVGGDVGGALGANNTLP